MSRIGRVFRLIAAGYRGIGAGAATFTLFPRRPERPPVDQRDPYETANDMLEATLRRVVDQYNRNAGGAR